jgi:hypothetical protein
MTHTAWSWPVPLETYDRRPELAPQERAALAESVERMRRAQTPLVGQVEVSLQRLTTPLWAALAASGLKTEQAQATVNRLLHQMHQRQTAYWSWSAPEWGEVATLSVSRHGTKTDMLCVAYLLGAMRHFYGSGLVYHSVIARRVFGKTLVDSLVERIEQTLVSWGYCADDQEQRRIETALTGLMLLNGHPAPEAMSYAALEFFRNLCPWALKRYVTRISKVFAEWRIVAAALPPLLNDPRPKTTTIAGVAPE